MKRILSIVAFAVIATAAFLLVRGLMRIGEYREGRMTTKVADLRFLQLAIQTFAADEKKANGRVRYPKSLQELVDANYLHQSDLTKTQRWVTVEYVSPQPEASNDTVILKAEYDGKSLSVPIEGDVIKQ